MCSGVVNFVDLSKLTNPSLVRISDGCSEFSLVDSPAFSIRNYLPTLESYTVDQYKQNVAAVKAVVRKTNIKAGICFLAAVGAVLCCVLIRRLPVEIITGVVAFAALAALNMHYRPFLEKFLPEEVEVSPALTDLIEYNRNRLFPGGADLTPLNERQ